MKKLLLPTCFLFVTLITLTLPPTAVADITLERENISWTSDETTVTFQLTFYNPDASTSDWVSGELYAQEYGAFLSGTPVGTFDIPPIPPESFFDVFMEVPRVDLPPSAGEITPWGTGKAVQICSPNWHWDGNVDVIWAGAGGAGQVQAHYGTLQACPGAGGSYIHVVTNCVGPATWTVTGLCAGFNMNLVNEDFSPAPNPVPAGWTGHIAVTANISVPFGTTCCFAVNFTCGGVTVPVQLCVDACDCSLEAESSTWGKVKGLYQ
jgi:hypothetical protein